MPPSLGFRDLAPVRGHLLLLLALALLGLGLVQSSLTLVRTARQNYRQTALARQEMQRRRLALQDEERSIGRKLARYREFAERGYLAREDRLSWVEQIGKIKAQRRLPALRFELAPQRPLGAGDDGYEMMSSRMTLELRLRHEEELLGFLADLRATATAYTRLHSCRLERLPGSDDQRRDEVRLQATCSIDWITLREKP